MSELKNNYAPEPSGANCHAKLRYSKQLLKNIHPILVITILLTNEQILLFTVLTPKNPKNHQLYATAATNVQMVTDGISRRVTSCRQNASLILVDHA